MPENYAFFKAAMLSFKELMILSASACFLRSISRTAAGALFTNFSLLSIFNTPIKIRVTNILSFNRFDKVSAR